MIENPPFAKFGAQMPDCADKSAVAIAETLLESTGAALMANDFDAFVRHFTLPQYVETFDGGGIIATLHDFRRVFDAVCTHYRVKGVTQIVRRCVSAEFKSATMMVSTHETRLLSGAQLVQKPFPAFSTLELVEEQWKVKACVYAIEDAPDHNKALTKALAG